MEIYKDYFRSQAPTPLQGGKKTEEKLRAWSVHNIFLNTFFDRLSYFTLRNMRQIREMKQYLFLNGVICEMCHRKCF